MSMKPEGYDDYRAKVAQACVDLMHGKCRNPDGTIIGDADLRYFFGVTCSYEEEFAEGMTPEEVAEAQWEAIT